MTHASILQGNCTTDTTSAVGIHPVTRNLKPPLRPLQTGQCVVVMDKMLLELDGIHHWLHNIVLRHESHSGVASISTGWGATLWMTSVTIQGDGRTACGNCGLDVVAHSRLYMEGKHRLASACKF
jgi:hypothetical protein